MVSCYADMKTAIVKTLNELSILLARADSNNLLLEMLQERMARLNQDIFNLVVIGQYKRGKTTFINALLEADILPTAIVPLTSIVTIIQYGEQVQVQVEFINGDKKNIDIGELAKYITETENPANSKQVKLVEIYYPSNCLKDGVRLIDTPGIGSVHQHNTDVTYSFLPKVDAAIFVLSADPPISREECQFLKDVMQHVGKIFFIQNKIDMVAESDREQSFAFSQKIIEQQIELQNTIIYPLSAKQAIDGMVQGQQNLIIASRITEFKHALADFIIHHRKETLLRSIAILAKYLINETMLRIDIEYSTIHLPVDEIKQKVILLSDHFQKVKQEKSDITYLLKGEVDRFSVKLEGDLKEFKEKAIAELKEQTQKLCETRQDMKTSEMAIELHSFLAESIVTLFQRWQANKEKEANDWLTDTVKRFEGKNNIQLEDIKRLAANLFQIQFQAISSSIVLTNKSELYLLTEINKPLFTFPSGLLTRILPNSWAQRLLLQSSSEQIEELVDLNCGRVRYDVHSRMAKTIDIFRRSLEGRLDQTMDEMIGTIEAAIHLKDLGEENVQQRKSKLESVRASLAAINKVLDGFSI